MMDNTIYLFLNRTNHPHKILFYGTPASNQKKKKKQYK